ncbi:NAC domain-containing protein 104-like isoform X2 [Tripterygium wilfordii]|uniref:NAC domain-containing protein 104-like isoform X2 n=1 Tax=Tripterygium wilfordii TaxID=458696 RepID=UPI0018F7E6F7|nr:NAC domain-containing protein 104-like isoform X2 [Tripterygium wilfordii]
MGDHGKVNLPPGFQFCPTDEELVLHFLQPKASRLSCHPDFIPVLDSYPLDPWELDGKVLSSGNQWYFFGQMMQNEATTNGFWKEVDIEEPILSSSTSRRVGMKRYLVFYINDEAQGGVATNWVMQEYRLCNHGASNSLYSKTKFRKSVITWFYAEFMRGRTIHRASATTKTTMMEVNFHFWMKCSCLWMMILMIQLCQIN